MNNRLTVREKELREAKAFVASKTAENHDVYNTLR
jgi:hypothetical protein